MKNKYKLIDIIQKICIYPIFFKHTDYNYFEWYNLNDQFKLNLNIYIIIKNIYKCISKK